MSLDGHQLALINNRLDSILRAMMNTMQRSARSTIINMARDFSCAIITPDHEILTVAESLPCLAFSGPDLQSRSMKEFHPKLRRGDAYLHNSPYHGNSHAADWAVLAPVIDASGVHHFTVYAKAHLADCGDSIPTTFMAGATDVYNEGALIFPCTKVQDDYELIEDVRRQCLVRIRVPEVWNGDFHAILGATRVGERRMLKLIETLGADTLRAFTEQWFNYTEQQMVGAIRELPRGTMTVSNTHDPIPGAEDGVPVNVTVSIDPDAAKATIDLRDNLDCLPLGLNMTEATARSTVLAGFFSSISRQVVPNAGSFRRIEIQLRENCVVGLPKHPASCSCATTHLAELVGRSVALAMAELEEGFGMAEIGKCMPPSMGVISGVDPRENGGPFVNFLCLLLTNGAGAPRADGWLTTIGIGVAGMQLHDSVEVDEMKYPIEVISQEIIPDSEGAGRFRGAPGAFVEYGPVDTELEIIYTSDGTHSPPRGVRGGHPGAPARQRRRNADGSIEELPCFAHVVLKPGETIISEGTGGGGYGPPWARDPRRVAKDVTEGWVSRDRARQVYGVALRSDGGFDAKATDDLRAALRDADFRASTTGRQVNEDEQDLC